MDQSNKQSEPIQVTNPAAVAMTFLERTKLKGKEVEYYAQTYNWLHSIVEGTFQVLTSELFDSLKSDIEKYRVQVESMKAELAEWEEMQEKGCVVEQPVIIRAIQEDLEDVELDSSD